MSISKQSRPAESCRKDPPRRWRACLLLLSLLLCGIWYAVIVSGNIRLDTDLMITAKDFVPVRYRAEGRIGLALLLGVFFPGAWDPRLSGILTLLFFTASAWPLVIRLWKDTGGKWPGICYALFFLLYGTSPVWAFQFYFSLQSAPVALGMLLAAWTAYLDIRFKTQGGSSPGIRILWEILACLILIFVMTIYQALIVYYAAAAVMMLFCRLLHGAEVSWKKLLPWGARIVFALLAYAVLARMLRGGVENPYLMNQIQWRSQPVLTCLWNIVLEFGKTVLLVYSGHFSLYPLGIVLLIILLVRKTRGAEKQPGKTGLLVLTGIALLILPLAMSILQGSRPVPRTQFALQIVSAFMPVCFMGETGNRRRWLPILCAAVIALQSVLVLRLANTDNERNRQDVETATRITEDLDAQGAAGKPLVITGSLPFTEDTLLMEKTDVFGLSFFEWSWKEGQPASTGVSAARMLGTAGGMDYVLAGDPGIVQEALDLSAGMPAFPEDGYLAVTDAFAVIKLSD